MTKNFKIRQIKERHSYTYEEASRVIQANKNSVRRWVAEDGLPLITKEPQHLILGADLKRFLIEKRAKKRVHVPKGYVYCLRCKCAVKPVEGSLSLHDTKTGVKLLHANCSSCGGELRKSLNAQLMKDYGF
ncbi:hypothetical protein BFP76_11170 [Amylibacter kogurei]|uniref:Helix-turn-helix domain-containing protein n=1 Tax=Paramylibacter kogurei TaxID=1889778 RepID=A0A2G5KC94_9RHOB|nr:helix-turn-helix domain-containing protein [Amylibacter kogurei]PIB26470.1 hypothetical protein BFP76_11170 [Amylibacter kogurei]